MSEMVERVARAAYFAGEGIDIQGAFDQRNDAHWAHWWAEDREVHEAVARAAIEAMKVPSADVLSKFEDMCETQCHFQTLEAGWAMMIDEALK